MLLLHYASREIWSDNISYMHIALLVLGNYFKYLHFLVCIGVC